MLEHLVFQHEQGMNHLKTIQPQERTYYFCMITYGRCQFRCGNEIIVGQKGEFVLLSNRTELIIETPPLTLHEKFSISFQASPKLIDKLPILKAETNVHSIAGIFELTIEKLRPLWKEFQEEQHYAELRIGSLLLDTLVLWQRELNRGELAPASFIHVERMKQYIQSHYREKITKEHLGDYISRSPNYAASLFKKGTSQTISDYVHAVRMKTAQYMLTESLLNVGEIAEYLGYGDVSYFQRLFKRTFGQSPSYYMNERRG